MVYVQITAPHFVAGYDLGTGNIAPIIRYMKGWTIEKMYAYCDGKGWSLRVYGRDPLSERQSRFVAVPVHPGCDDCASPEGALA